MIFNNEKKRWTYPRSEAIPRFSVVLLHHQKVLYHPTFRLLLFFSLSLYQISLVKKKHSKIEHRPNNHISVQIKIRKKRASCKHKFSHFSSTHPSICPLTVNTHIKPRQSFFACQSFRVGEIKIVKIFTERCSIIYPRAFFNRLMATRFLYSIFHLLSFIELKSIKSLKKLFLNACGFIILVNNGIPVL